MKHVTTFKQSRMLAEILPKESADMYYMEPSDTYRERSKLLPEMDNIAWSLGALLEQIPYPMLGQATDEPNKGKWYVQTLVNLRSGDITDYVTDVYDTPIEACIDAITELHSTTKGGEE